METKSSLQSEPVKPTTQTQASLTLEQCEAAYNANLACERLKASDSVYGLLQTPFEQALRRLKRLYPDKSDEECLGSIYTGVMQERAAWLRAFTAKRGPRYEGCSVSNFDATLEPQQAAVAKVSAYAKAVVDRVANGNGLILFGPKGTGKDHLLCALTRHAIISHGYDVAWVNGVELFGKLRDTFGDNAESETSVLSRFKTCQILYISDPLPPSGVLTEYQQSALFRVLDARYSSMRPTWVSVNVVNAQELDSRIGSQNGDRFRDGATAVFCNWPSYRKVEA